MNRKFILTTDATCDLTDELVAKLDIKVAPMRYMLDEKEYLGTKESSLSPEDFYSKIASGLMPKTSMVNQDEAKQFLQKYVSEGTHLLHIAFSSQLSGTCHSFKMAAEELCQEIPDCHITIVDSLSASLGEGLLCYYAAQAADAGKTLEETVALLQTLKMQLCHYFTVDSLIHLHRGGRVSKATAVIGSILNIKPLLHVNELGQLIPIGKTMGRRKALTGLVDKMQIKSKGHENPMIFISHGDAREDAEYVGKLVTERFGITDIHYGTIGPVIGTHSGKGTVALFFIGSDRLEGSK